MSSSLSGLGGPRRWRPSRAAPERCTNLLMLRNSAATSSRPDTWLVSTPATRSSPFSSASSSQLRGSRPERAQGAAPARLLDRRVGRADLGGGLLVVHVLELHERAVAGGEEARLDGLAAAVRADPELEVRGGQLARVGAERAAGLDAHGLVERLAALQLQPRVHLQVGALDRLAERPVEQVLHVSLIALLAAGDQGDRHEDQNQKAETHAAQGRGSVRRRPSRRLPQLRRYRNSRAAADVGERMRIGHRKIVLAALLAAALTRRPGAGGAR